MSDPERLLQSGTADPEVRELLQSLRNIKPSSGTAVGSWGAMAAKVATLPSVVPPPSAVPAAPHGVIASASHAVALKVSGALVATSLLGGGLYWAHAAKKSPAIAAPPAVATALPTAALVVPAAPEPSATDPSTAAEEPSPAGSASPQAPLSAALRVSRLDAEASLLAKVRAALRGGDAHGALVALNQLQAQFPKGALGQERDVLAIEVLAANGKTAAARRKAAAFIAAHPSSPYSAKLERFVEAQ